MIYTNEQAKAMLRAEFIKRNPNVIASCKNISIKVVLDTDVSIHGCLNYLQNPLARLGKGKIRNAITAYLGIKATDIEYSKIVISDALKEVRRKRKAKAVKAAAIQAMAIEFLKTKVIPCNT